MRKIFFIILAIVVVLTTAIAFIYLKNSDRTLTVMVPKSDSGDVYNLNYYALNMYSKDKEIDGKIIIQEEDGIYYEKIANVLENDNEVDMFYTVFNSNIRSIDDDLLHTLSKPISKSIPQSHFSYFKNDEGYSYVPVTWAPWGIYYNKEVFQEFNLNIPETFEELLNIAETLNNKGIIPFSMIQNQQWPITAWFDQINLYTNGIEFHNNLLQGKESFTSDNVRKTFNTIYSLIDKNYFNIDNGNNNWKSVITNLEEGKCAMYLGSTFYYNNAKNKEKISWFNFPGDERFNIVTSSGFIINENENTSESKKYLKAVLEKDLQINIFKNSGLFPVNQEVFKSYNRDDLNYGYMEIVKSQQLIPSFERNCHKELLIPLKWSLSMLFQIESNHEIEELLKRMENMRLKLSE